MEADPTSPSVSSSSPTVSSSENLLSSVLKELKRKTKRTPPVITVMSSSPNRSGIAEYKAYSKVSKGQSNGVTNDTRRTPLNRALSTDSDSGVSRNPLSPPTKPRRKKKSVVEEKASDSAHFTTELHSLIESAFSVDKTHEDPLSSDAENCDVSPAKELGDSEYYDATKEQCTTLNSSNFEDRECVNEENVYENCFRGVGSFDNVNDPQMETASMFSFYTDDENEDDDSYWQANGRRTNLGIEAVSLTSITSADGRFDGKKGRKKNARAKAKLLKKQAAAQKDRVGAFLDATAATASERIKKIRRPSIKIPGGKSKFINLKNRIGANKQNDKAPSYLHASLSANNSASDSDDKLASNRPMAPPSRQTDDIHSDRLKTIKSGYLKKQGSKMKNWSERWFVLQGDRLHYYKERNGKYLSSIPLSGSQVNSCPNRGNETSKFTFEIIPGSERTKINNNHESYLLSSSSQADMEEWTKSIKRIIMSPFGGGIFGQTLVETLRYDQRLDAGNNGSKPPGVNRLAPRQVPIIVENCVEFIRSNKGLSEEGLFRLPGQSNEVKDLQDAYDNGDRPVFPKTTDVHTVASLLKGYLRELPEPVIPFELYEDLINAVKLSQSECATSQTDTDVDTTKDNEKVRRIIKEQVDLLPQANFDLLRYLCSFLDEVRQNSSSNKMDASNLALVFGPNMMRAREESAISMMADTSHVQQVMIHFITDYRYFFPTSQQASNHLLPVIEDDIHQNGDAGIGTLTTTGSPRGTLRLVADDSGTGSLDATPENTQKRAPPVPIVPPPTRKPIKPHRRRQSSAQSNNEYSEIMLPARDQNTRKSYYDNVSSSPNGNDADTLSNSSVHAVAGSVDGLDSPRSNASASDHRPGRRTASLSSANRPSAPVDSVQGSLSNSSSAVNTPESRNSRTSSYPKPNPRRIGGEVAARIERMSIGSASDESSVVSHPAVPSKPYRRSKKINEVQSSSSQRSSKTDLEGFNLEHANDAPSSVFERRSAANSVSSRVPTYKDLEEQVKSLKEDLQKQRLEHEKRSAMLEEHYIMKMRGFIPSASISSNGGSNADLPGTAASGIRCPSAGDCTDEFVDASMVGSHSVSGRRASVESQVEFKLKEEKKRHAMTKIKLRNAERGLKQAEERNQQLQKEMEQFFNTFGVDGGMIEQAEE